MGPRFTGSKDKEANASKAQLIVSSSAVSSGSNVAQLSRAFRTFMSAHIAWRLSSFAAKFFKPHAPNCLASRSTVVRISAALMKTSAAFSISSSLSFKAFADNTVSYSFTAKSAFPSMDNCLSILEKPKGGLNLNFIGSFASIGTRHAVPNHHSTATALYERLREGLLRVLDADLISPAHQRAACAPPRTRLVAHPLARTTNRPRWAKCCSWLAADEAANLDV
mmetsp:Transcript_107976/g.344707  ORF Transcript_107976/g.344707 Transcript_107976/m.344707 type:complete len:223 (-) Transcript_107976:50-718(-)